MGIEFDGVDDTIPFGDVLINATRSAFSISVWIYPHTEGEGGVGRIMSKYYWGFTVGDSSPATLNGLLYFHSAATTQIKVVSVDNVYTLNAWNHIVMTLDGTAEADNVHFYVNGVEVSYVLQQDAVGTLTSDAGYNLRIGSQSTADYDFDGIISECAMWNVVIGAASIAALYAGGAPARGVPLTTEVANLKAYWAMNDGTVDTSADGDTVADTSGAGLNGTAADGANNTGCTWRADSFISTATDATATPDAVTMALTLTDPAYAVTGFPEYISLSLLLGNPTIITDNPLYDPIVVSGCPQCGTLLYRDEAYGIDVGSGRITEEGSGRNMAYKTDCYVRCRRCGFPCKLDRDHYAERGTKEGWGVVHTLQNATA